MLDSDEEEEDQAAGDSAVTEREAIANELFEGGEDAAGEVLNAEHVCCANLKSMNTKNILGMLLQGGQIKSEMTRQETVAEFFSLLYLPLDLQQYNEKMKSKCSCSLDLEVIKTRYSYSRAQSWRRG